MWWLKYLFSFIPLFILNSILSLRFYNQVEVESITTKHFITFLYPRKFYIRLLALILLNRVELLRERIGTLLKPLCPLCPLQIFLNISGFVVSRTLVFWSIECLVRGWVCCLLMNCCFINLLIFLSSKSLDQLVIPILNHIIMMNLIIKVFNVSFWIFGLQLTRGFMLQYCTQ